LAREIRGLREVLRETLEHYTARVDGELAAVLSRLEGEGARPLVPRSAVSRRILERMGEVRLKPEKGRAKDLVRIQKLVADLSARIDEV
jgi:hypothetical protein